MDRPDSLRKKHSRPTPRIGGAAVVLSAIGTCALVAALPAALPAGLWVKTDTFIGLIPATAIVFLTGLADDILQFGPAKKLVGQAAAAALAVASGIRIWPAAPDATGVLGAVLTGLWLVFSSNAFNLIDGVDGLAAGTSAVAAIGLLGGALMQGNYGLACGLACLIGAIGGFVAFNVSPATVFLGDSGSLTMGFLLGCYATVWADSLARPTAAVSVALLMAVPLGDASFAVLRRLAGRRHIFEGDRRHIHHRLLDRGLNSNSVSLLLCGFSVVAAGSGLLFAATESIWCIVVPALAGLAVSMCGRRSAPEPVARSLSRAVEVRRAVDAIERRFTACETADECWNALVALTAQFDIPHVRLQIRDTIFEKTVGGAENAERWNMTVPAAGGLAHVHAWFRCESPVVLPAPAAVAQSKPVPVRSALRQRSMGVSA